MYLPTVTNADIVINEKLIILCGENMYFIIRKEYVHVKLQRLVLIFIRRIKQRYQNLFKTEAGFYLAHKSTFKFIKNVVGRRFL